MRRVTAALSRACRRERYQIFIREAILSRFSCPYLFMVLRRVAAALSRACRRERATTKFGEGRRLENGGNSRIPRRDGDEGCAGKAAISLSLVRENEICVRVKVHGSQEAAEILAASSAASPSPCPAPAPAPPPPAPAPRL